MKKGILLGLLLAVLFLAAGCGKSPISDADAATPADIPIDLEIKEKMFVAQSNDVYLNEDDYIGKTIKYEGMFFASEYEPTDSMLYLVMRYGPGCCGTDGVVGFEVAWDDGVVEKVPEDNDWVEVIGTLERYEEEGLNYLRLNLASMRVLDTRGAESVLQ